MFIGGRVNGKKNRLFRNAKLESNGLQAGALKWSTLMKRPEQHVIEGQACKCFESLVPDEWAHRPQPAQDYGIDHEVEVFAQGQSTGIIFKVQIKGEKTVQPLHTSDVISFSLEIGRIRYLADEMRIPTFLVLVDVTKKEAWWYCPQTDVDLSPRLAEAIEKSQGVLTLHIPYRNRLSSDWQPLLEEYARCHIQLASKSVVNADLFSFADATKDLPDLEEMEQALIAKAGALRISQLDRLHDSGDFSALREEVDRLLGDPATTDITAFAALLYREKLILSYLAATHSREVEPSEVTFIIAEQLNEKAKNCPDHLKHYAKLLLAVAKLNIFTHRDYDLYLWWKVNKDEPTDMSSFYMMQVGKARHDVVERIRDKYNECGKLLLAAMDAGHFDIVGDLAGRMLAAMQPFLLRLWNEGLKDAAKSNRKVLMELTEMAVAVTAATKDWNACQYLLLLSVQLGDINNRKDWNEIHEWADKLLMRYVKTSEVKTIRRELRDASSRHFEAMQQADDAKEMSLEDEEHIYRRMAEGLGINLDDPDDEIANIVRIGINDLNPERVLQNCQHLFVRLEGGGIPAEMLRLPTAGFKTVFCTLHGGGVSALELDNAYKSQHSERCESCTDRNPHPEGWRWSREWQIEQNEKHKAFLQPIDPAASEGNNKVNGRS